MEVVLKEEPEDEAPAGRLVKLEARESTPSSKKVMPRDMVKVGADEKLWVPWFESKLHKCNICGEVRTCGLSFKNHIYDKHQYMSRKQYVKRFPGADIEPEPWSCTLCRNTVKWTKKCIVDHLKSTHSMTREEFEETFNMPAKHLVDAPAGGEYNFNARTELGLANKNPSTSVSPTMARLKCGLCDEEVDTLAEHIDNYHKMSKEAYLKICPKDANKFAKRTGPMSGFFCKICEEITENTHEAIKEHLDLHAIDLKDYEKTFEIDVEAENDDDEIVLPDSEIMMGHNVDDSMKRGEDEKGSDEEVRKDDDFVPHRGSTENPWYEVIKITCEECKNSFWLGQFMKHIILTHKLPIKTYKLKYPNTVIPKKQYTCRICGMTCSHYASPISGHLTGRHNMTMTEYYEKYEKHKVKPPTPQPAIEPVVSVEPSALDVDDDESNLDNPNSKNQRMAEFQKSGKIPWYESKTTVCRFCNEEWLLGSFRRHLYDRHDKVSRTAYAEMFPDADIALPIWRCKICGNGIKWVRDNIFYHLRTHNFTMEGYRQIYIEGNGPPPATVPSKPMPNLVPISVKPDGKEEKQFRCKLCNTLVAFESEAIKNHLKTFHNMSINDYQPISHARSLGGPPGFNSSFPISDTYMDISPKPAIMNQPYVNTPLYRALMQPSMLHNVAPLQTAPQTTLTSTGPPWYNKCKWTCMICNKAFSSGFWRHVSESHSVRKEDYLQQFGKTGIEIVNYFCKICNKKIPWSGASINAHTKAEHAMTLKEYEVVYGPQPVQAVVEAPKVPAYIMPPISNYKNSQIHLVHAPNKWFNGCEYKCQLCGRILYSVAGLAMHLKDTHMMDKFSYFREFGRTGINIRKYRCKICLKSFPWSGVSISKHVKQAHNMSLQRYSNTYEAGSTTESIRNGCNLEDLESVRTETNVSPSKATGLKWYNKCSWTCQECGSTISTNSSAFYKHVVQDHGMPIHQYKEKHGNTGFVYVDHTCKLCNKKVPFNGLAMCKHFKHTHNMQLEEYELRFMRDDDGSSTGEYYAPTDEFWYNKCLWKCQICGNKNKSLGSSKKHIHKVHNMPYEDYAEQYGTEGILEVDFKCKICKSSMSCNGVTIASHLLNNHKLTLTEYEKVYLKGGQEEEDEDEDMQDQSQEGQHFLAGIKTESEPMVTSTPVTREEPKEHKDKAWYQKCKYFCQICNNPYFSISALRNHTKVKHNMDRDTYVSIYGVDAGKVIEDYICKICHRTLKCEGRSLNAHMRNCHKMGILEYSNRYEANRNTNDDPNYYSETYQIELDNDEGGEEEHDGENMAESIGIDEDMEDSVEASDPLANFISTEVVDDDYCDEDMTVEESLHFNFDEEDAMAEEEEEEEQAGREVKPDISQIEIHHDDGSGDEEEQQQGGSLEITSLSVEEGEEEEDEGEVSMGVLELDHSAENPLL